ncbi:hypothetical protein F5144DRAFT_191267 [Chaetomium tenue]|uniref:Uncharacterized protein n=1 Tax=Chaetomium tenue TaxID=1854479 RepID=A0ACB7PD57_9PEZI|nr:hypothetical protein F5144DRAFT_191267 [Chaetomium globosum]
MGQVLTGPLMIYVMFFALILPGKTCLFWGGVVPVRNTGMRFWRRLASGLGLPFEWARDLLNWKCPKLYKEVKGSVPGLYKQLVNPTARQTEYNAKTVVYNILQDPTMLKCERRD